MGHRITKTGTKYGNKDFCSQCACRMTTTAGECWGCQRKPNIEERKYLQRKGWYLKIQNNNDSMSYIDPVTRRAYSLQEVKALLKGGRI